MNVTIVPIDQPRPDPENARLHPRRQLDALRADLTRFGQRKPIVLDRDGIVRAGHGLLEAARSLGWREIAVLPTDLAGTDAAAFELVDNRAAELAEWDFDALRGELRVTQARGDDLLALGWAGKDLQDLVFVVPDLGSLAAQWGTDDPTRFWPVLRLALPPELFARWEALVTAHDGDPQATMLALLGVEVPA